MKKLQRSRFVAFVAVFTSLLVPVQHTLAVKPTRFSQSNLSIQDIALGQAGTLSGQVVDRSGQALAGHRIVARATKGEPVMAVSGRDGKFQLVGLRGGLYEITTEQARTACRCWTASAAPPHAKPAVLLVKGDNVQRGQRPIGDFLGGPVLIGLIIAAAIAIPIAVHNSQKSAS